MTGILLPFQTVELMRRNPGVVVSQEGRIATIHPIPANAPRPLHGRGDAQTPANDCKESSAMNKPIEAPHAETRQGKQMVAAIAIAKACEHGLPEIHHWAIDRDQQVRGMVRITDRWLADLTAWAEFLAPAKDRIPQPKIERAKDMSGSNVAVTGTCHGVRFTIYHLASKNDIARLRAKRQAS